MLQPRQRFPLPPVGRAAPWLWGLAVLNMVAVAWMVAAGSWLDHASPLTTVMTLGGHHRVVLGLAVVAFVMLTVLAIATHGFTSAQRHHVALIVLASAVSVVALAGAMSVIMLLLVLALIGGLLGRLLSRR